LCESANRKADDDNRKNREAGGFFHLFNFGYWLSSTFKNTFLSKLTELKNKTKMGKRKQYCCAGKIICLKLIGDGFKKIKPFRNGFI